MFSLFDTKPRMSGAQKEAEQEAIRLLTHAQQLLMESDSNVEEAQRIRFEVTEKLLPPRKLFIVGEHPQSLLKDVDTRIRHAYIRYYRDQQNVSFVDHTTDGSKKHSSQKTFVGKQVKYNYNKINQKIYARYLKAASRSTFRYWTSAIFILLALAGTLAIALYLRSVFGTNSLYSAFNWLHR